MALTREQTLWLLRGGGDDKTITFDTMREYEEWAKTTSS
jgi:hypothetical protein